MIVLGIDPGLANVGYGVVARRGGRLVALDGGMIRTTSAEPIERRLVTVHDRVRALLTIHDCMSVALEDLYFGRNVSSAFAVGQARGVCVLAAAQQGLPAVSYTPQQIKAAVCGHGGAGKEQVARMVRALLTLSSTPKPDHVTDALAVAICHINAAPLADAITAAAAGAQRG